MLESERQLFWSPGINNGKFIPRGSKPVYVHPYEDMASTAMPRGMRGALEWSQFIVTTTGPYRSALRRIVAYCITKPEIQENSGPSGAVGKEVRENYETVLSDKFLKIKEETLSVGMDLLTYGNAFVSVFSGFTRYLICNGHRNDGSNCCASIPLKEILESPHYYNFSFKNMEFHATCPFCGHTGEWKVSDQPSKSMDSIFVHRWSPLEMEILDDPFAKTLSVVWDIPEDYKNEIRRGVPHVLQTIPMEVLQAIRDGGKFKFNDKSLLHITTPGLSGLDLKGWGLPSTLANFRQAWLYQTCNRHTETTAMEALAPLRILSPPQAQGAGDPTFKIPAGQFVHAMSRAVNMKRRDPSSWTVTPFPVQYQAVGGDASQFIPRDLLDFTLDALLTSAGIPVEMYKGTMTMQAAPVALRLFTSYWQSLVTNFNVFLQFVVRRVSEILGWEPVSAVFSEITQADDINRQVQTLQLMSSGLVSRTTGLGSMGIDQHEEVRRMAEEQRDEAEQQEQMQKEMETSKQMGDMVGGGTLAVLQRQQDMMAQQQGAQGAGAMGPVGSNMPVAGGTMAGATVAGANGRGMSYLLPGMDPISQMIAESGIQPGDSIEDIYAKAQSLAQQFMMGNTASCLRKLQKQDPQLHTIVKGLIEQMRSNAASQGREMVLQQEFGGGGGPM